MRETPASLLSILFASVLALGSAQHSVADERHDVLPGTERLTLGEPLDEHMVAGINRYAHKALRDSPQQRASRWSRDYSSPEAYEKSIAANRERFRTIIGAVDARVKAPGIERTTTYGAGSTQVGGVTAKYRINRVHWQVLDGVTAQGLYAHPFWDNPPTVIVVPDADWTPEMLCGLSGAVDPRSLLPLRLAERNVEVLIPTLISRDDEFSGNPLVRYTNQPHREFVYRMAFEMGRHVIGYEVQKVLAAVDIAERRNADKGKYLPIAVAGVGEGGLIALAAAAIDPRIDAVLVSGYFQEREGVWEEPIYRNIWSQLTEFGDAELASLIAPRPLVIEACAVPEVSGPPAVRSGRSGGAAPGRIVTAPVESVRREFERAAEHYKKLNAAGNISLVVSDEGRGPAFSQEAQKAFMKHIEIEVEREVPPAPLEKDENPPDPNERQRRQVAELVDFTQRLLNRSARVRDDFWKKADRTSVDAWTKSAEFYRNYVWEEMIGKLPEPTMPLNPRTRKVIDDPAYTAYEVMLDVYPDVVAGGILLLPKDLKEGEKRPVVVCQHGLEGVPMDTITKEGTGYNYYKSFAAELAKRGFITYAPQNPYRGKDNFRVIQRKSNPMKRSLFSYIIRQHERTLDFLESLPNVDASRIGFYGLSYGGKTAVRVPPIVTRYACSICSADFDEWVKKNVSSEDTYSYIFTPEYEMFEWNLGHVANYAELSTLMTPRPFMVERGHHDGVAPDEWVAWEFAKVFRHYNVISLGDKAEIEYFNGPHTINGQGTYEFLHRHLKWPKK
ncbi:MAG: alpha/beta hydrolase family protein [Planctomycetaceae bacterium]